MKKSVLWDTIFQNPRILNSNVQDGPLPLQTSIPVLSPCSPDNLEISGPFMENNSMHLFSTPLTYQEFENTKFVKKQPDHKKRKITRKKQTAENVLSEILNNTVPPKTNPRKVSDINSPILFPGKDTFNWDEIEAMETPVTIKPKKTKTKHYLEDSEIKLLLNNNQIVKQSKEVHKGPMEGTITLESPEVLSAEHVYSVKCPTDLQKAKPYETKTRTKVLSTPSICNAILSTSYEDTTSDMSSNSIENQHRTLLGKNNPKQILTPDSSNSFKTSTPVQEAFERPLKKHAHFYKTRISTIKGKSKESEREFISPEVKTTCTIKSLQRRLDHIQNSLNNQFSSNRSAIFKKERKNLLSKSRVKCPSVLKRSPGNMNFSQNSLLNNTNDEKSAQRNSVDFRIDTFSDHDASECEIKDVSAQAANIRVHNVSYEPNEIEESFQTAETSCSHYSSQSNCVCESLPSSMEKFDQNISQDVSRTAFLLAGNNDKSLINESHESVESFETTKEWDSHSSSPKSNFESQPSAPKFPEKCVKSHVPELESDESVESFETAKTSNSNSSSLRSNCESLQSSLERSGANNSHAVISEFESIEMYGKALFNGSHETIKIFDCSGSLINKLLQSSQCNGFARTSSESETVKNCDRPQIGAAEKKVNLSDATSSTQPAIKDTRDLVLLSLFPSHSNIEEQQVMQCSSADNIEREFLLSPHELEEPNSNAFQNITSQVESSEESCDLDKSDITIYSMFLSSSGSEFYGFSDNELTMDLEENLKSKGETMLHEQASEPSSCDKSSLINKKCFSSMSDSCTESMIDCFLDLSVAGSSSKKKLPPKTLMVPSGSTSSDIFLGNHPKPQVLVKKLDDLIHQAALNGSLTTRKKVMCLCRQTDPIAFSLSPFYRLLKTSKKIGEGSYGEVFKMIKADKSCVAVKIIPVEGKIKVNGESQLTFKDVLSEIIFSKQLHNLSKGTEYQTSNFICLHSVSCLRGSYPKELQSKWKNFKRLYGSVNDNPKIFPSDQLYIAFEFSFGGTDLELYQLQNEFEAESILQQVACSLAVAEGSLEFEHRDLHWGNVLVSPTSEVTTTYMINGTPLAVQTSGVSVAIIDYSLSRMNSEGAVIFKDLSQEAHLFSGKGDIQYGIYREMKTHTKNKWEDFHPFTNILWLEYLLKKLLVKLKCPRNTFKERRLRKWKNSLSKHKSATSFVEEEFYGFYSK